MIPYAYDYLFLWMGERKYNTQPLTKKTDILYTLYEVDPNHPERLESWLDRQKGIARVMETRNFGGITVQKRERIKND